MFLGFRCPLQFLSQFCSYVLPGRKSFWGPGRCGHWGFQIKCIPRSRELIFRNGDGLEGVRGSTSGKKVGCSTKTNVVPRNEGRDEGAATTANLL